MRSSQPSPLHSPPAGILVFPSSSPGYWWLLPPQCWRAVRASFDYTRGPQNLLGPATDRPHFIVTCVILLTLPWLKTSRPSPQARANHLNHCTVHWSQISTNIVQKGKRNKNRRLDGKGRERRGREEEKRKGGEKERSKEYTAFIVYVTWCHSRNEDANWYEVGTSVIVW